MLRKAISEDMDWEEVLPQCLFAINTAPNRSTGVEPFRLARDEDIQQAHSLRVAPRQQRGPRRRTDRGGRIEVREAYAFAGHLVELRCLDRG